MIDNKTKYMVITSITGSISNTISDFIGTIPHTIESYDFNAMIYITIGCILAIITVIPLMVYLRNKIIK